MILLEVLHVDVGVVHITEARVLEYEGLHVGAQDVAAVDDRHVVVVVQAGLERHTCFAVDVIVVVALLAILEVEVMAELDSLYSSSLILECAINTVTVALECS